MYLGAYNFLENQRLYLEMNLILSSKAAKKLNKKTYSIEDFSPDLNTWRIDCVYLVKRSVFIITNEKTLYTRISSYKSGLNGIIQKITSTMQCEVDINEIRYIKHQNRSIIGSMNDMKRIVEQIDKYSSNENETYEKIINQTPFKYLSQRTPSEVHFSSSSMH